MATFIAIDFETANHYRNSACALGITKVHNDTIIESRSWLIRPNHIAFHEKNIAIHHIFPEMVMHEPTFGMLAAEIMPYFEECDFAIAHNAPFDFGVLSALLQTYDLPIPVFQYSCSVQMARKAWPHLSSHKLNDLATEFGFQLNHHDPKDDSRVCAEIIIKLFQQFHFTSITDFDTYFQTAYTKQFTTIIPKKKQSQLRVIQPETTEFDQTHPFYHQTLVFSGRFHSLSRQQAIVACVNVGAIHQRDISSYTDILVISERDYQHWQHNKGMSHKLAFALQHNRSHSARQTIHIITELQFLDILKSRHDT